MITEDEGQSLVVKQATIAQSMQIATFNRVQRQDAIGKDMVVGQARKDGKTTREVVTEAIFREPTVGDGMANTLVGDDIGKEGEVGEEGQEAGEGTSLQEVVKLLIDLGGQGQRYWHRVTAGEDSYRSPRKCRSRHKENNHP